MPVTLPIGCLRLLDSQDGVIAVGQAVSEGMSDKSVRDQVRAGRWQLLHRGIYAGFTGKPPRQAELWGALLRAGADAVLSHQTAAEAWGLLNGPSRVIVGVVGDAGVSAARVRDSDLESRLRAGTSPPPRPGSEEKMRLALGGLRGGVYAGLLALG